jgi:hypothetical protein
MQQGERFFTIVTVLIVGLIVQIALGFLDQKDTPAKVAVDFSKAYFNLDRSMADYLCEAYAADEEADIVDDYIKQVSDEARVVGYEPDYMRFRLFSVHTEIVSWGEDEAEVHIEAVRKRNINPVFTIIAKLFFIGETHSVDETLKLVKEDGEWKVCGRAYDLSV